MIQMFQILILFFFGCKKLREIKGINNFKTSQVSNIHSIFYSCEELQYLDLSNFETSKVTDMGGSLV